MTPSDLSIKHITKHYKNKHNANNDISLTFKTHEITALIGHNGAGKTTLLNQISGLIVPTEGQVLMNHIDISRKQSIASTLVSSMPQFQAPLKGVTLLQAIQSIAMIKGFSRKESKARAENIITKLQLEKWKDIPGEKLSGGLQRLTSFAMSVVVPTPVIILDEPTNDVDPIRRGLMWEYLRELATQGAIVIIVTHNLLEVEQYADRYILLDNGCVKEGVNLQSLHKDYEEMYR